MLVSPKPGTYGGLMTLTDSGDTLSGRPDVAVRLRLNVYEALAVAKGFGTVESQAKLHGIHRATMHALRAGENVPRLDTAMRMAADLGVAVEVLWERVT